MIHSIPGVRGGRAYLVEHPDGLAVIDPGYTGSHPAVLRFLAAHGWRPADLQWVILTHHHVDHAGAVLELCRLSQARLAVHVNDAPYLAAGRPRERLTFWGLAEWLPARVARFLVSGADVARALHDGDVVAGLRVIHAPGHTPGSICLWSEADSALFLGDVLNNERGLRFPPWTVNRNRRQARHAPGRLLGLAYEHAYFGHGQPIHQGASLRIERFVEGDKRKGPHPGG
jgi:glyoxylase-like metal-dependent hydrolase (beta-lactamase superfamily II)